MNEIVLMGRLTRDPELRTTGSGTPVCSFTLAVYRDYNNGEKQTDFIDCVAWRKTAEFVNRNFLKGKMAAVTGSLQLRDWTDKDGNKRRAAEVNVRSVHFCGDKGGRETSESDGWQEPSTVDGWQEIDDESDLPF